jgi:hypothetical protein
MMVAAVSRFRHCDKRFFPYLEKVLNQLPDGLRDDILGDQGLQIIGDEGLLAAKSKNYTFKPPITDFIYLNTSILKRPVLAITYTIAYELANYLVAREDTNEKTKEKKVKNLLVDWEFIMDLDRIRPAGLVEKSRGYRIGYEWAKRQKLDDLLWNYKEYFDEWHEERISLERFEQLYIDVAPFSILEQMDREESDDDDNAIEAVPEDVLEAQIIWGLMAAVKELIHDDT